MRLLSIVTLPVLAGCQSGGSYLDFSDVDFEEYVDTINPILVPNCSSANCHGSITRPFSLYGVHQFREDPEHKYRDYPLTEEELYRNYMSVLAISDGVISAELSQILQKPLPVEYGGSQHLGGVWFESSDDYEYNVVLNWLEGP